MSCNEKIAVEVFRVEEIPLGTKGRFHLVIDNMPDGGDLLFPALIVRGRRPGKTLLVTGGTHGDEYEGVVAIQDVFESLDPSVLEGTFFGIPVLNAPAFIAAQREGVWDHLNLARVFPGSSTGSPTQRIAHAFQEFVVDQADLYLDIHSAGSQNVIQDLAGYQIREGELGEIQRKAAFAFGFDLVWGTAPSSGRTLNAAADKGVPSIYVEMRGSGQCRPEDLEKARSGIKNVLSFLGIVEGPFPGILPACSWKTHLPDPAISRRDIPVPHQESSYLRLASGILCRRGKNWGRSVVLTGLHLPGWRACLKAGCSV